MKLSNLRINNFRCFSDFTVSFNDNLTVIVGGNGAGKSSLLDAISIAIGTFLTGFDGIPGYGIANDDALKKSYDMGSVIDLQPQFPVSIEAKGTFDGEIIEWKRELNSIEGRTTIVDAKDITSISAQYQNRIREGDKTAILPIISYYGTGRLWAQKKDRKDADQLQMFSRLSGYIDCLAAQSNEKLMLKWFQKMTIQDAQNGSPSPEFQAVRNAMAQCFVSITGHHDIKIQFNLDTYSIDVIYEDTDGTHKRFPMKDLSDGYKNTLSMIADIAYRMAILNPQLLDRVLTDTSGIVLIDEIDLHLHPLWQQRIIGDLRSIFPQVQFIVSTHAPAVIHSVKHEQLLIFEDNNSAYMPSIETYGRDANSILKSIMQANERPKEILEKFSRFYALLSDEKYPQATDLLSEIENAIGSGDPELMKAHVALELEQI